MNLLKNDLEVGELAEGLVANVALVVHFAVLLLQRIWKRAITASLTSGRRASGFRKRSAGRRVAVQRLEMRKEKPVETTGWTPRPECCLPGCNWD